MADLGRLSFSIDKSLLKRLNKMLGASGYANRSKFIRDMIRSQLVKEEWNRNEEVVGSILMIYDHHVRGLTEKLVHLQHHQHAAILATTHVHLDKDLCAEMLLVKGRAGQIKQI